jgi:hypothetical protein
VDLYADFNTPSNDASCWVELGVTGAVNLFTMLNVPGGPDTFVLDLP